MTRRRQRSYVARAELVLARPDTDPLGEIGLKPDPLQAFALALGRVARPGLELEPRGVPAAAAVQRRRAARGDYAAERDSAI